MFLGPQIPKRWIAVQILFLFVVLNAAFYNGLSRGDDLSSSYLACKLLAHHQSDHLYDYDPVFFHRVSSSVWTDTAKEADFTGFLHPYIQAPLWAFSLEPLCRTLSFFTFNTLFLLLEFASLAGMAWLTAVMWAPIFLEKPLYLAIALAVFSITEPVKYMGVLSQTHPIFLFASLLSIFLADRGKPLTAGVLLAIAASVKITPAIFVLYWLRTGQWKAVGGFFMALMGLIAAGVGLMGMDVTLAYLANLHRISDVLLVAYNNQSLAAWVADITGEAFGRNIFSWRILYLSPEVKLLSYVSILAAAAIFAGVTYKRGPDTVKALQSYSLCLLLLASTMFANIAWSHYYIVLIVPLMLLIARGVEEKNAWLLIASGIVVALNLWPLSLDQIAPKSHPVIILRSQFWSGMLCLGMLVYCLCSQRNETMAGETRRELPKTP